MTNPTRTHAPLHRLGVATTRIADKAESGQDRLKVPGEALGEAGQDQPDEEEDAAATAAPKRARKQG